MILNEKKTKVMIFNFTQLHQFTTRLKLNNIDLEIVKEAKLLGVWITDDLKWDKNTNVIVQKANVRMQILRKAAEFTSSIDDKLTIYILYVRSILEQSCVVWHNSLTAQNSEDLERVQRSAVRLILGRNFENYEDVLDKIGLQSLHERREEMCLKFAQKCLENEKTENMFPLKTNYHSMRKRKPEIFKVNHSNTDRLKSSAIPSMQRRLNETYLKRNHG